MEDQMDAKKKEIESDIQKNPVMLYMKGSKSMPQCGFSAQVAQILSQTDIEFETRDVLQDEILRQAIKAFSDWPTIPQLYINGDFIGGSDIVNELFESGELMSLLTATKS